MSNFFNRDPRAATDRTSKALTEGAGLLRGPHRIFPLLLKLTSDGLRRQFQQQHLYSYANTTRPTADALRSLIRWILNAQRPDGGIAAFYSLLSGYSPSYPEVTGYIIPTLYDFAHLTDDESALHAAERATRWLLSLQMASGAFPSGLHTREETPSVFNTGQILQGLVRAYAETKDADILARATAAGDWLTKIQQPDGSWSGPAAYQEVAHTYYSMVSWALVLLSEIARDHRYAMAADKNIDWALTRAKSGGWIDGINLRGYPNFLHFIAYVIQGVLECGILRRRSDVIQAASKPAWLLLRRFEITKRLLGTYEPDFSSGRDFTCLTGNAQMACVWSRLFEATGDLRYLNAALKMNEMLKQLLQVRGRRGVVGGLAGSDPIWGAYQPLRYISWGCKFFADALMLEERLTRFVEASECAS
jgi:prenyltransferase beta subunit